MTVAVNEEAIAAFWSYWAKNATRVNRVRPPFTLLSFKVLLLDKKTQKGVSGSIADCGRRGSSLSIYMVALRALSLKCRPMLPPMLTAMLS
jgi:hypothetical protein